MLTNKYLGASAIKDGIMVEKLKSMDLNDTLDKNELFPTFGKSPTFFHNLSTVFDI